MSHFVRLEAGGQSAYVVLSGSDVWVLHPPLVSDILPEYRPHIGRWQHDVFNRYWGRIVYRVLLRTPQCRYILEGCLHGDRPEGNRNLIYHEVKPEQTLDALIRAGCNDLPEDLIPILDQNSTPKSPRPSGQPQDCLPSPPSTEPANHKTIRASESEAAGPTRGPKHEGQGGCEPADLVTLDQAAASVHKSKRTLERFKTRGTFPSPTVEGGGGKADLYDWKVVRPWLMKEYNIPLPEKFPRGRDG